MYHNTKVTFHVKTCPLQSHQPVIHTARIPRNNQRQLNQWVINDHNNTVTSRQVNETTHLVVHPPYPLPTFQEKWQTLCITTSIINRYCRRWWLGGVFLQSRYGAVCQYMILCPWPWHNIQNLRLSTELAKKHISLVRGRSSPDITRPIITSYSEYNQVPLQHCPI